MLDKNLPEGSSQEMSLAKIEHKRDQIRNEPITLRPFGEIKKGPFWPIATRFRLYISMNSSRITIWWQSAKTSRFHFLRFDHFLW